MRSLVTKIVRRVRALSEWGLSTAELLGNTALALAAMFAIWLALKELGLNIVGWIWQKLQGL